MKKIIFFVALFAVSTLLMAQTPMSGTYTVGTAAGSNYSSLSAAVAALNTNGVGGNVILEITSDITEPANIGLGVNTGAYSITIRPDQDADRTITFTKATDNTSATGHFIIGLTTTGLGVAWNTANVIPTNNVTIDGFAEGGSTRRLTFTNSGANYGSRVISVVGGCANTTIKNCNIINTSTGSSPVALTGIVLTISAGNETFPTNLTVDNDNVSCMSSTTGMGIRLTTSIFSGQTASTTAHITGFVLKNSIISAQRRVVEINLAIGGDIHNNTFIFDEKASPGSVTYGVCTNPAGTTAVSGTFNIYGNNFTKSVTTETAATTAGGHRVLHLSSGATYNVYNNFFAGLDKTNPPAGTNAINLTYIFFGGAGSIYNNTFYMPALTNASAGTGYYSAIQLSYANPNIENNIFINDEPLHPNAYFVNSVTTGISDYNVYYMRTANPSPKFTSATASFTAYQTANSTKDLHSVYKDVTFVDQSIGDLRLSGASVADQELGMPLLPQVTTDMFGTTRASTTFAGAYEANNLTLLTNVVTPEGNGIKISSTTTGVVAQFDGKATIELYTVNGILIEKTQAYQSYSHDLNKGIYILRVNGKAVKFVH